MKTGSVIFIGILLCNSIAWGNPDYSTPRKAVETILKAALDADVTTLARSVCSSDVESLKYLKNSNTYSSVAEEKKRRENEYKLTLGSNVDDFILSKFLLQFVLPLQKPDHSFERELFSHNVILNENIWADKYAEVKFMVPYNATGTLIVFPLIKENGEWKFAQWLATDMFISGYGLKGGLDRLVSFSLRAHALITVNRSDCSKLKSRKWGVPKAVDAYYENQVKTTNGSKQKMLWELWLLTASPKAVSFAGNDPEKTAQITAYSKNLPKFGEACNSKEKVDDTSIEKLDPAIWFNVSQRDILGLKNLIKTFPNEQEWKAKAELQIGSLYENMEDRQGAQAKYLKVISAYPTTSAMPDAKAKLANLYWNFLNKQSEAMVLWKELDAIGQLPANTAYSVNKQLIPQLVYEEKEDGDWLTHLVDFIPGSDGKVVLLSQGQNGKRAGIVTLVDYVSKSAKNLVDIPGMYFKGIKSIKSGYVVYDSLYSILFDKQWTPLKIFKVRHDLKMSVEPYSDKIIKSGEASALVWDMHDGYFNAWLEGGVAKFDYTANRTALFPRIDCERDDYMSLAQNNFGVTMYASNVPGCAGFIGPNGESIPLKDPLADAGRFNTAQGMTIDRKGNIYIYAREFEYDVRQNKVVKLSPDGGFINEYKLKDEDLYINAMSVMDDGRLLLCVSGARKPYSILVVSKDNKLEKAIEIGALQLETNPAVNSIAAAGHTIYLGSHNTIVMIDFEGNKKGVFGLAPGLARLSVSPSGDIYFTNDKKMYKIYGTKVEQVSDFPKDAWFDFLADGTGIAYYFREGMFAFDPKTRASRLLSFKSPTDFMKGLRNFGVDPSGRIVVSNYSDTNIYVLDPKTLSVTTLPRSGGVRHKLRIKSINTDTSGNFYLADDPNRSIIRLNKKGEFTGLLDLKPLAALYPRKFQVDNAGSIYFLSTSKDFNRIYKLEAQNLAWVFPK